MKRDQQWRAGNKELIKSVEKNKLSKFLRALVGASDGRVIEIIVMGKRGCNIAVSSTTSDYWQGDEDKWKKTFAAGTDHFFADIWTLDKSTRKRAQQISKRFVVNGQPVGAITVAFDIVYRPERQ
ncbi:MAG: hypothetical protein AAGC70_20115 [Pseudomonadota bacterium]